MLEAIKEAVQVPISFEQIDSGAKGFYHLEDNRIVIQEGMSEAQTVKTLLHEASHQALHSREAMQASGEQKSKNQKETEAEPVAYVVCQHYGIDTSDYSFAYVATWSADKEVPELKASLDTIRELHLMGKMPELGFEFCSESHHIRKEKNWQSELLFEMILASVGRCVAPSETRFSGDWGQSQPTSKERRYIPRHCLRK